MRLNLHWTKPFRKDKRAASPAISTVIITSAVIVMVLVAMLYSQDYLDSRLAENEFATNTQFMLTTSLQMDDVAWTIGRTQTVRYTSKFAHVDFEQQALQYSIEIQDDTGWHTINDTLFTGAIMFNMPVTEYSLGNNYYEPILPSANSSFVVEGPAAPVSRVYILEKLPMNDGEFTRVIAVPSIRQLTSLIDTTTYVKFYLPLLASGSSPHLSQSVTLVGKTIHQYVNQDVNYVLFKVSFPKEADGFDHTFFPFEDDLSFGVYETLVELPPNSVVEFYIGEMAVSLGAFM